MTMATQVGLPPIHDPIVETVNGQVVMAPSWVKWFNDLYDLLSLTQVEGRDDALPTDTRQERIRFIQLPSHTTATRDKVSNPADGTIFYNSTIPAVQARVGGVWTNL